MKAADRHVSLNYFILPGFTDDPEEYAAFCELIATTGPDLIQLRNLNMDPEQYRKAVQHQPKSPPLGMLHWLESLKSNSLISNLVTSIPVWLDLFTPRPVARQPLPDAALP